MPSARDQLFGPPVDSASAWLGDWVPPSVPPELGFTAPDPWRAHLADDLAAEEFLDPGAHAGAVHEAVDAAVQQAALAEQLAQQTQLLELQSQLQHNQQMFAMMSNMQTMQHNTSMAIINNMGGGGPMYEARDLNQDGWIGPGE